MGGKQSSDIRNPDGDHQNIYPQTDLTSTSIYNRHPAVSNLANQNPRNRQRTRSLAETHPRHQLLVSNGLPTSSSNSSNITNPTISLAPDRTRSRSQYTLFYSFNNLKCPLCNTAVSNDGLDDHLIKCMSKPKLIYNEEVIVEKKGECVICFEDMSEGNVIARLPCFCFFHKKCIDKWFEINRTCPEHPGFS